MKMFSKLKERMCSKRVQIPAVSVLMMSLFCFPAFAADGTDSVAGLLANFTTISAWLWQEVGLLLTFIMGQPILFLTLSLFFIGAIVAFLGRVYHTL